MVQVHLGALRFTSFTQYKHKFMREIMRSKIHKATVTDANIDYIGSITIDEDLIDKAGFWPGEKVLIVDNTNGARLETYIIKAFTNLMFFILQLCDLRIYCH